MKILGILGSPRDGGNTEIMLDIALEEAKKNGASPYKISLRDKTISPCNACMACVKTGRCSIKDDMGEIYERMLESDGILWATPVYFWSMTAQTKTAMDRTYALTFPKLQLANKIGGLIAVAGSRGSMNVADTFHMYFSYNHMFFAEFAWGYAVDKGEITKNAFALNAARETANQMVGLIRANPRYPEEFDLPMPRYLRRKYPS